MSRKNGRQVQALTEKFTPEQLARRAERLHGRSTWRNAVIRQMAMTHGVSNMAAGVVTRGFWGRVKWLLAGR